MKICDICEGRDGTHSFACPKAVNEEVVVG
jgi:hypothetical protein